MENIIKWLEPAYKAITTIGIVGIFVLNLWLQVKFVNKEEFEKYQSRISTIEVAIIKMETKAQTDFRQDETLKDHEIRLRNEERRR